MIVMPIEPFEMASILVFGRQRVVELDVDQVWRALGIGLLYGPADQKSAERLAQVVGGPRTDPQAVGHIGDIGRIDELPPERGKCLARLADQERVGELE